VKKTERFFTPPLAMASFGGGGGGRFGRSVSLATPDSMADMGSTAAVTAAAAATLPDLSHLTDEERSIIEDVMKRHHNEESRERAFFR